MSTPLPPEWDAWKQEGARLLVVPPLRRNQQSTHGSQDPKFALGDFLVTIPPAYVEPLADALGSDPGQFRMYREVAATLPAAQRRAAAWTVHRDLRRHPHLLTDGLTVRQAAALLGKPAIDAKPQRRQPLEERAANVRAGLADPEVYKLIDNELAQGRAERTLRHRARQVQSEHTKRARDLDAELRAAREAKSPFEATVQAQLEVNKAMQIVEAISQTLDDLPQPERLLNALNELNTAAAAVLLEHQGTTAAPIIEGEVWQTRPARAALDSSNQRDLPREGRTVIEALE